MLSRIRSARSAALSFIFLGLWNCGGKLAPQASLDPRKADPALLLCQVAGGVVETRTTDAGPLALCRLERAMIAEWTLYRALAAETPQTANAAVRAFLLHKQVDPATLRGNPASAYCVAVGGTFTLLRDDAGNESGGCFFRDRSMIEEWTLFRGPDEDGYGKLAALLRQES